MELLESDDMKSKLLREAAKHHEELKEDVQLISEKTEKIIVNALVIGGSLALAYFLATRFAGSGKKKSKTRKLKVVRHELPEAEEVSTVTAAGPPGILSQVGTAVANQVTLMLLDLAKEKLTEFVQSMSERKDKEQGNERS